jgi:hypothetical protein
MSQSRKLRCYQYVERPYADVRDLLHGRTREVLQRATGSAVARASGIGASLHAGAVGVDIGVDVRVHIQSIKDEQGVAGMSPVTRIGLAWEAQHATPLFPVMHAELSFWPLMSTETQIELEGSYQPPLGLVGSAVDAAIGHRLAEAVVHRFLGDLVEQLRRELPPTA